MHWNRVLMALSPLTNTKQYNVKINIARCYLTVIFLLFRLLKNKILVDLVYLKKLKILKKLSLT